MRSSEFNYTERNKFNSNNNVFSNQHSSFFFKFLMYHFEWKYNLTFAFRNMWGVHRYSELGIHIITYYLGVQHEHVNSCQSFMHVVCIEPRRFSDSQSMGCLRPILCFWGHTLSKIFGYRNRLNQVIWLANPLILLMPGGGVLFGNKLLTRLFKNKISEERKI